MKHLLAALVLVTAVGIVAGVPSPPASTVSPSQITLSIPLGILDGLQDFIGRIDQFLEAVVDLLETLQQLFGGGEGGD